MTIRLSMAFTSQPLSTNSQASQSSSSGWVGQAPCEPKSSSVVTSPWPKTSFQSRLTITRATSGLSRAASHRARSRRVSRRSLTRERGQKGGHRRRHHRTRFVQPVAARQYADRAAGRSTW